MSMLDDGFSHGQWVSYLQSKSFESMCSWLMMPGRGFGGVFGRYCPMMVPSMSMYRRGLFVVFMETCEKASPILN